MRILDSSAIVPLLVEEPGACRRLLRQDSVQVVWCLSRVEIVSALWRQVADGALGSASAAVAERRMERLAERWAEVDAVVPVRETEERLLRVHRLRAADALQVAAALVAVDHRPRRRAFVSFDELLLQVASAEGFDAVVPR